MKLFNDLTKWLQDAAPHIENSLNDIKAKDRVLVHVRDLPEKGSCRVGHYQKTKLQYLEIEYVMRSDGSEAPMYLFFDRDFNLLFRVT